MVKGCFLSESLSDSYSNCYCRRRYRHDHHRRGRGGNRHHHCRLIFSSSLFSDSKIYIIIIRARWPEQKTLVPLSTCYVPHVPNPSPSLMLHISNKQVSVVSLCLHVLSQLRYMQLKSQKFRPYRMSPALYNLHTFTFLTLPIRNQTNRRRCRI